MIDRESKMLFWFLAIVIVGGLTLIYVVSEDQKAKEIKCEELGGTLVRGPTGLRCIEAKKIDL